MRSTIKDDQGFSLLEVMIAMVILAFSILGVMGLFQWGDYGLRQGVAATRALAMAQARIEAKRTTPWESLLADDLDLDGLPEIMMHDDGLLEDVAAGDGIFTACFEREGIQLVWTIQFDRGNSPVTAGAVVVQAKASYSIGSNLLRNVKVGTLRANPRYVGRRS